MADKLKVFIAGSKALSEQRNIFRAVLMRLQGVFDVRIEAKTFEDFPDALVKGFGHQEVYNEYIANEADIVVFVFDSHVGGITKDEFDVAYHSFDENDRPQIFVYCRKGDSENNDEIKILKDELDSLKQYYIEYTDNEDLEHSFWKSINNYLVRNNYTQSRKKNFKIILIGLIVIAVCMLGLSIKHFSLNSDDKLSLVGDTIKNCPTQLSLKRYKELGVELDFKFQHDMLESFCYVDTIINGQTYVLASINGYNPIPHHPVISVKFHNKSTLTLVLNQFYLEILDYVPNNTQFVESTEDVDNDEVNRVYRAIQEDANLNFVSITSEQCKPGLIPLEMEDRELVYREPDKQVSLILDFPENCDVKLRLVCKTVDDKIIVSTPVHLSYISSKNNVYYPF